MAAGASEIALSARDLGGVVTGDRGPEAGVWVIAETTDLPTRFAKIVVTDEMGRFVIPDLPHASYQVWVRGYGLVDSPKVGSEPGRRLSLKAVTAPSEKAAARVLPGRVLVLDAPDPPTRANFPGTGEKGNGHRRDDEGSALLDRHPEERMPVVPRTGFEGNSGNSRGVPEVGQLLRRLGAADPGRPGDGIHGPGTGPVRRRESAEAFRRLDRPDRGGRIAVCQGPSAPRAWSAMWWSRSGTGPRLRTTCTTPFRPTSAIRPSTPTV